MEIKDIKQFMEWCTEGERTYSKRRDLFIKQKKKDVEDQIKRMNRVLDMIKFKCWYYDQAIADGSEDQVKSMSPEEMPDEIRKAYENTHEEAF